MNNNCKNIKRFIKHIFGAQYETGLDYIQLLLLNPTQKLPVLCLYSEESATGKSSFAELLNLLFEDEMVFVSDNEIKSEFGHHLFADKLLAICEGACLSERQDLERLKILCSADELVCNPKGLDIYRVKTCVKLVFLSNSSKMFSAVKNASRVWAIKTKKPELLDPFILDKMKFETYSFLKFIHDRALFRNKKSRFFFDVNLIKSNFK